MSDQNLKWIFTFFMIVVTVGWAIFSVLLVSDVAQKVSDGTIEQIDVIGTAGAGTLAGALIGWDTLIIQYWFRKKPAESENENNEQQ